MKKRFTKALAAFLCAVMVLSNNGLSTFADTLHSDVTGNDIAVYEENVSEVSGGEDIIVPSDDEIAEAEEIIEEEEDLETFTDEFGYSFTYSPLTASGYNYVVDVSGQLTGVTDATGKELTGRVVLPDDQGIKSIGASAFAGNTAITYVAVPEGTEEIDDEAFKGCTGLIGASLPKGLKKLGDSAFEGDTSLVQIAIPKSLEIIGKKAFYQDSKLNIVYLDDTEYSALKTIDDYAFAECTGLTNFCHFTSVKFPANLENIGAYAFKDCKKISKLPLSAGISTMGAGAFSGCTGVESVSVPKNLEVIPESAFEGCILLTSVGITDSHKIRVIGKKAFKDCENLGAFIAASVKEVGDGAFQGCVNLVSIKFYSNEVAFGADIFDDDLQGKLYVFGLDNSDVSQYVSLLGRENVIFAKLMVDNDNRKYGFKINVITGSSTGTVKIVDASDKEIPSTGIEAGTKFYIKAEPKSGYTLKSSGLKVNGTAIKLDDNKYSSEMVRGGVTVTAEFVLSKKDEYVTNKNISVEYTNGEVGDHNSWEVTLKSGEKTKATFVDSNGNVIPSEKYSIAFQADKKADYEKVVSYSNSGVITTLAAGTAKLTVTFKGQNDKVYTKTMVIIVETAKVSELHLKATSYDNTTFSLMTSEESGIQTLYANANNLNKDKSFNITLTATAYDKEETSIIVPLSWSSTDDKVAKVKNTATTNKMTNTVTIPVGAKGEAVITVSAKISSTKSIKQKFIISIQDYTPRLLTTTVNVNPNKLAMGTLKLIESYGAVIADPEEVHFTDSSDFTLEYAGESEDGYQAFTVYARKNLDQGSYKATIAPFTVKKGVNGSWKVSTDNNKLVVNLNVKKSKPSPKVSFDSSQKIDTLYKNEGKEIVPTIKSLGSNTITSFALEALTTKENDKKFLENFGIDSNTGVITQKSESLIKRSDGKYALTGYLVMSFAGYRSDVTVKKKITIPTKTTSLSYKLDKKQGTINDMAGDQQVVLTVLDSNKKNTAINLADVSNGEYKISVNAGSIIVDDDVEINSDGKIVLNLDAPVSAGSVKLKITNTAWNDSTAVNLTYKVKTSAKNPTISLSSKKVTVNKLYPEETKTFTLKSDQYDTKLDCAQTFTAKPTRKNASEIGKIRVEYDAESKIGTVTVTDPSIKTGEYKFECVTNRRSKTDSVLSANKVTLIVKVESTKPVVKLDSKTVSINQKAFNGTDHLDTAKLTAKTTKLPDGYYLDEAETIKTLACTTKNKGSFADSVKLEFEDGRFLVSLKNEVNNGTYSLSLTPQYTDGDSNLVSANSVKFSVKVYSADPSVGLTGKGTIDLVKRVDPDLAIESYCAKPSKNLFNNKNSIIYTPSIKNINDRIISVKIFDAGSTQPKPDDEESALFNATLLGKKIYVSPKPGAELKNNATYKIMLYTELENYDLGSKGWSKILTIKTAQNLPKVKEDKSVYNLYLSNKSKTVSFVVKPESDALCECYIKESKAQSSFEVTSIPKADGTLLVTLRLKDTVSYAGGSQKDIKLMVKFVGQGTNTDGVEIVRTIKINK